MKAISKIVFGSVRYAKRRSLLTLAGVSLSAMLITLVCSVSSMLYGLAPGRRILFVAAIFVAVGFAMGVICIYGTFNAAYDGRVKLVGTLASLGMTKKQLAQTVAFESLLYGVTGAVIGTGAGTALSMLFKNRLLGSLSGGEEAVNGWSPDVALTVFGALLSVAATAAASYRPVKKLTRLTVMEAVTDRIDVNISLHKSRVDKFVERKFGFNGRLARLLFENHKKNYRVTSLALSGGTVFFVWIYSVFVSYREYIEGITALFGTGGAYRSALIISAAFVAIFTVNSLSSLGINFEQRKREYAILITQGVSVRELCRISLLEAIFLSYYTLLYGFIGAFAADAAVFLPLWIKDAERFILFLFPFPAYFIFAAADVLVCFVFSLYNILKVRRMNVIPSMKI